MKKFYRFYMLIALFAAFSFAAGCLGESSISPSTIPPSRDGKTDDVLPYVTGVSGLYELDSVTEYSGTSPVILDVMTKRVMIEFSESMDESTITADSVYVRNVASAPVEISGQTVYMNEDDNIAVIEWTDDEDYTLIPLEAVVESTVTDLSGNGLAGLVSLLGFGDDYPYNETVSDFRAEVGGGALAWTNTPNWRNIVVSLSITAHTATTVSVEADFNTGNIAGLTVANFLTSGGTIDSGTFAFAGTTATFDVTGLTENTEYTITFDPTGARIDTGVATRMYPDGATALGTLTGSDFLDTFGEEKGHRSDYVLPFMMYNDTATIPTIVSVSDQTATIDPANQGYNVPAYCIGTADMSGGLDCSTGYRRFRVYLQGSSSYTYVYLYNTTYSLSELITYMNSQINATNLAGKIKSVAIDNHVAFISLSYQKDPDDNYRFRLYDQIRNPLASFGIAADATYTASVSDLAVQIEFSAAADASALEPENYIVYGVNGLVLDVASISPYYIDGDPYTEDRRVLISTLDLEMPIYRIVITHNVTCGGIHLDGDLDGALEGGIDYDQDADRWPDDWVVLDNGVEF